MNWAATFGTLASFALFGSFAAAATLNGNLGWSLFAVAAVSASICAGLYRE